MAMRKEGCEGQFGGRWRASVCVSCLSHHVTATSVCVAVSSIVAAPLPHHTTSHNVTPHHPITLHHTTLPHHTASHPINPSRYITSPHHTTSQHITTSHYVTPHHPITQRHTTLPHHTSNQPSPLHYTTLDSLGHTTSTTTIQHNLITCINALIYLYFLRVQIEV